MAKFTKKAIIYGFLRILKEKSLDKVTVKDICELCEINRNTFYYYFDDVYDVLDYIFQMEKEAVLKETEENPSFYDEYRRSAAIILNNKKAVIHIAESKHGDTLRRYLEVVIDEFVRRAVEKKAEGHNLSEDNLNYIIAFYTYAILGSTMKWIDLGLPPYKEDMITQIAESFEVTIKDLIGMFSEKKSDKS